MHMKEISGIDEYGILQDHPDFQELSEEDKTRLLKWILNEGHRYSPRIQCRDRKKNNDRYSMLLERFREEMELQDEMKEMGEIEALDHKRKDWDLVHLDVPHMESLMDLAYWLYWKSLSYMEEAKVYADYVFFNEYDPEFEKFKEEFYDDNGEFLLEKWDSLSHNQTISEKKDGFFPPDDLTEGLPFE